MFDAFPWKIDTEKDTENVQMKLINLQQDTNVTFSQTKKNAKISIRSCRRTHILKPGP
jgi:hypothetical protein